MLSKEDALLNSIFVVSVTRQTMPNTLEVLCECNEEVLKDFQMQYKLDWIWDNKDNSDEYSQEYAIENYYENADLEDGVEITFEDIFNLANEKRDLTALAAVLNGDVNQLNEYSVTTMLNIVIG